MPIDTPREGGFVNVNYRAGRNNVGAGVPGKRGGFGKSARATLVVAYIDRFVGGQVYPGNQAEAVFFLIEINEGHVARSLGISSPCCEQQ